jgi:hypothetical protein
MSLPTHFTDAASMRRHLSDLYTEQAAAGLAGLLDHGDYRSDLEHEIAFMRNAYVGAAVTEIAVLRADLGGRLRG